MRPLDDLCRSWLDLCRHFDPAVAVRHGAGTAARPLGRFDEQTVREHLAGCRAIAGAVEALPIEARSDEIDRVALLADLRHRITRLEHDAPHRRSPVYWLEHLGRTVLAATETDPTGSGEPLLGAILRDIPSYLESARQTLSAPPVILADAGVAMVPALIQDLSRSVSTTAMAPGASDLADLLGPAEAALAAFRLALVGEIEPDQSPHAPAVGEDRYRWILHHAWMIQGSPGEVWRYGQALADEAEAEVGALAETLAPGEPWREVVARLARIAPLEDGPVAAGRRAVARARDLTAAHDLVRLHPGELRVAEAPTWLAALAPFSGYEPPVPGPGAPGGVFYLVDPAATLESDSVAWRDAGLDRHRLEVLVVHDGWPGRQAQALAALGASSDVRQWTASPIAVAGWGCYAEELMLESGAMAVPEQRLAQRVMLMLRALRAVIDVGIHTERLTPAAAVDLLLDRLPMHRLAALAEVRRACADPGTASAFALGRREYLALRRQWAVRIGVETPPREFHDAVLAAGRIPPALVRWELGLD